MSATLDLQAAVAKLGEIEREINHHFHRDDARQIMALLGEVANSIGRAMGAVEDARELALKGDKL